MITVILIVIPRGDVNCIAQADVGVTQSERYSLVNKYFPACVGNLAQISVSGPQKHGPFGQRVRVNSCVYSITVTLIIIS